MNKLIILENMGFSISWKLIRIGLDGLAYIPRLLSQEELFDYLEEKLATPNEQVDNIISLICEKDCSDGFERLLTKLADQEKSNSAIQLRKWRVYMLIELLNNLPSDCLQGILELMEFWVLMECPDNCPHPFPSNSAPTVLQDYFSRSSYNYLLKINREWCNQEIKSILELEGHKTGNGFA